MIRKNGRATVAAIAAITTVAAVLHGCAPGPSSDARGTADSPPPAAGLPEELSRRDPPPDAASLLPPLAGYRVDDAGETGELEASLDHGPVPYAEVRRRRILDDGGFAVGEVTVVTLQAEPGAAQAFLRHRYGEAPRSDAWIDGVKMQWIRADPFPVLAWVGPAFVVTFERGQSTGERWAEDVASATIRGIARSGR